MDYSNLEVKTIAFVVNDPLFIEAVLSGNLHDVNSRTLFNIDKDHEYWNQARDAAKVFQFGYIQYGGSEGEIYISMSLLAPNLQITQKTVHEAAVRYFDYYKIFSQWRESVSERAVKDHIAETAFGRVRYLTGNASSRIRQGLNFPGQGTAAGVINRVQAQCIEARNVHKIDAKLQIQIYDDLRWECRTDQIDALVHTMKPIMEQEFIINGIPRNFTVDVEFGPSWGTLEPYEAHT